jgi:hypothetical protein
VWLAAGLGSSSETWEGPKEVGLYRLKAEDLQLIRQKICDLLSCLEALKKRLSHSVSRLSGPASPDNAKGLVEFDADNWQPTRAVERFVKDAVALELVLPLHEPKAREIWERFRSLPLVQLCLRPPAPPAFVRAPTDPLPPALQWPSNVELPAALTPVEACLRELADLASAYGSVREAFDRWRERERIKTMREAAKRLNLSPSTLYRLLRGDTVKAETREAFCRVTGCPVDVFDAHATFKRPH